MVAILKIRALADGRPVLRGWEHFWASILDLGRDGGSFTANDVDQAGNERHRGTVTDYLRRLEKAGYITRVGETEERYAKTIYRLAVRQTEAPRLRRDGEPAPMPVNQLMWNTIRNLLKGGFNARELADFASTDEARIGLPTAKSYIQRLADAGYLHCLAEGAPRKLARYRLKPSMNTGPKAPMILRTKAVFDPNRNAFAGEAQAEEMRP